VQQVWQVGLQHLRALWPKMLCNRPRFLQHFLGAHPVSQPQAGSQPLLQPLSQPQAGSQPLSQPLSQPQAGSQPLSQPQAGSQPLSQPLSQPQVGAESQQDFLQHFLEANSLSSKQVRFLQHLGAQTVSQPQAGVQPWSQAGVQPLSHPQAGWHGSSQPQAGPLSQQEGPLSQQLGEL
jgi:hypothetical protein